MKNVLIITSSLNPEGNSTRLSQVLNKQLTATSGFNVTVRDVGVKPLPHLSGEEMGAWMQDPTDRSPEQAELAAISDDIIEELHHTDTVVFAVPMYNFGIPSTLKAYIDRICRAGITFRYSENGPVGLLENKKAIVLAARGGMYAGTDRDTQTKYLKDVFSFIGITDVDFVYAEGLAMGEDAAKNAWKQAEDEITKLVSTL